MKIQTHHVCSLLAPVARAAVLWDGRFNDVSTAEDLNKWSWSNQVGPYQYYIHGSGPVTEYVELSPDNKNPADTSSKQGVKITLTDTAYWNGQNMRRTELIPQTSAPIASGKVYYHFSIKRGDVNAPALTREHQIAFFESHFTELKSGWLSGASGTEDPHLRWMVGGQTQWSVDWEADVWHNVAYEIDFSANTVGFWHSVETNPLEQVVAPVGATTSSNGADWHLGVLELPRDGYADQTEDFYFSGVYIESGELTKSVTGRDDPPSGTTKSATTLTTEKLTSTRPPVLTTSRPATTQTPTVVGAGHWSQCGGSGWTGPSVCTSTYTCSAVNSYYHQCL